MKMSELSAASGIPVPTIKFYLRENLLARGDLSAPNHAQYGDEHLKRLDLIRVLQKKAGMSLADVSDIVEALDGADGGRQDFVGVAADRLPLGCKTGGDIGADSDEYQAAEERLRTAVAQRGWVVSETARAWGDTVRALAVIDSEWVSISDRGLGIYMESLEKMVRFERRTASTSSDDPQDWVLFVALGTLLLEPVILGLRRLAHVDQSSRT